MIDLHVHFGQFYDKCYNPEQIIDNLLISGVEQIGYMPILTKKGDNIIESHEIFKKLINKFNKSIIPILWIHPNTKICEIEKMLDEVPYKIIKIHGYFHDWHNHIPKMMEVIRLAKELELPIMFHTGGRKESNAFSYKRICMTNPENIFILAHSRPLRGTINVMRSCPNVYCDIAFTPITNVRVLIENKLEDRILFGTDYPIISEFKPEIDKNVWYKERLYEVKSLMSDTTFNKVTKLNFITLLK